jgi:hypothetical protein
MLLEVIKIIIETGDAQRLYINFDKFIRKYFI